MKKFYLVIAGTIVLSAVTGASLATISRQPLPRNQENVKSDLPEIRFNSKPQPTASLTPFINSHEENKTASSANSSRPNQSRRKPIRLTDEVPPGSDFDRFRQRLRQAVQNRDAQFLRSILPPNQVGIGFGIVPIADLKLENRNANIWLWLEKALAVGCIKEQNLNRPDVAPGTAWICNNVPYEFSRQYPNPTSEGGVSYELNHAVIVGTDVNVRTQPSINSSVISSLSNEVVKVNRQLQNRQAEQRRRGEDFNPINGWTPILLADGRSGYVYNRFVYSPLEYRAVFGKVNGQWRLLYMPGGD